MANYAEVIYCKDCDYYKTYYHAYNNIKSECMWWLSHTNPHDFCSKAKQGDYRVIPEVLEDGKQLL